MSGSPTGREVATWVAARTPGAPAPLAERVASALHECGGEAARPEACLAAAESMLARLVAGGAPATRSRDAALDLLAADALATYAFEAASEEPASLAAMARDAIGRLARHGAAGGNAAGRGTASVGTAS